MNVTGTGDYVGGVVGYNNNGTLTGCSVSGNVSGSYYVGGVVGQNYGTVTGCYAACNVSGRNYVGGVAGYNNYGTLTACYASSTVTGTGNFVGGVVGYNLGYSSIVTACYWSNYDGSGIGVNNLGSGDVTKVDGTAVTWETAQKRMNEAIDEWNTNNPDKPCDWRYDETDAETPPVLTAQ